MAIQLYKNGERISGSGVTINSAGGTAADVVDTTGAETVSDGVDLITVVTRDTDQTITSDKIISGQLTSSGNTVFTTPTAGDATTTVATTAFVDRDFEKVISGTNQVAYATELSGLPTLGNLAALDNLTAAQITALSIPLPVSSTNQVAYATELSGVPTTFAPSAHTHVLADVTDSGSLAALNNVDYTGSVITNKPFTHATQAAFESAVDTRITTIGDVVIFANAAAFTSDSSSTTWHKGDVAIIMDTNVAYLFTGTDGDTTVTLVGDFHQITSTETLTSLGITISLANINGLTGLPVLTTTNQNIAGTKNFTSPLSVGGSTGVDGQVLTSTGPTTPPAWEEGGTSGSAAADVTAGILGDDVLVGDQNSADGVRFWVGAEAAAPTTRDPRTLYIFTS